jgi:translation initiation factor IF-2
MIVTQVRVKLLFSGVGPVSASDVALASASGATILAFNVRQPPPAVEADAKRQGIQICTQRIIYRLLEEVPGFHHGLYPVAVFGCAAGRLTAFKLVSCTRALHTVLHVDCQLDALLVLPRWAT